MINNLYTTFEQLVHAEDAELLGLFKYIISASNRSSSRSDSQFMQMITIRPAITGPDAHDKMQEVLNILQNCGNDPFRGMRQLKKILTQEGIMRLFAILYTKTIEQDEDIIAKFISPSDLLDSFFTGMPLFRVVVEDVIENNEECSKSEGRYIVYLENRATNVREKITFKNKDSKILYIWFLKHPHMRFGRKAIIDHKDEFLSLVKKCYEPVHASSYIAGFYEKCIIMADSELDEAWSKYMKTFKKDSNFSVNATLAGRDEEMWYIIDFGPDKNSTVDKYSISLTSDFINLPQSLDIL